MPRNKHKFASLFSLMAFISYCHSQSVSGLGAVQTNIPWRAGHASVYTYPYVILYGGSKDITTANITSTSITGSNDVWVWDSRNGSWYQPTIQVQGGVAMLPQIYFKATLLPSQGQIMALVSNTSSTTTNMLQKLDINSWLWSFPASNVQSSSRASGYTLLTINNTIYTYGGLSADVNGLPMTNALQNTLSMMDANTYQWTTGANGLGLADHTTCYMKICDCLITFGGTPTGNPTEVTDAINIYDLGKKVWNVQGIQMAAGASTPSARRLHTANCLDDYMVIYGGGTNQPADTDVWILNATAYPTMTWQKMTIANQSESPSLRMGHSSVLDETNKKIYMFGGWGVSATNDSNMYVLDVNKWSWTRVPVTGYPIDAIPSLNGTISTNTNTPNTQLSSGAIAGIAVGSIAGALLLIAAAVIYMRRRKRRQREESEKSNDTMMIGENLSESLHHNKESPFYYNSGGYYNTNDDDDDNNNEHGYYYAGNDNGRKRISKAWVGLHPSSTQQSLTTTRRSEIGDYSDRVVTGVLEALEPNDGSVAARSANSNRGSKILLAPNNHDTTIIGQVPNEIIAQKPNEFSIPATRHQHIHTTIQTEEIPDVPPSCSDVLKMNGGSSMLNHTGHSQYYSDECTIRKQQNHTKNAIVPVTHARVVGTINREEDPVSINEDEANANRWTSLSSSVYNHPTTSENITPPIQYILNNSSHQILSAATSTQTWDTTKDTQQKRLVQHHLHQQQYPSSTLNMPIAETVTPPTTTTPNSSKSNSRNANELGAYSRRSSSHSIQAGFDIYNAVSPLDVLASLGQQQQSDDGQQQESQSNSRNASFTIVKSIRDSINPSGKGGSLQNTTQEEDKYFQHLRPLISILPHRYKVDKSKIPIVGPSNSIVFAFKKDQQMVAIKSFGRREAWERECRTLVKLKSPCVVEILEVLTIQGDNSSSNSTFASTTTSTPETSYTKSYKKDSHDPINGSNMDDDKDIQYVTVMERLDETLNAFIHKQSNSAQQSDRNCIARDILKCLSWCHSKGIAFCDLKPSNIMHQHGGRWKLIDFEASRTINEECVGVITPRYCSPEVARATTYGLEGANGVVATASVDLWSLGCVIYELETKKALFPNNMKDETILHFVSHPSPSTPILNNGLRWNENKELEIPQLDRLIPNSHTRQLIRTLLSRDPSKRGSASQLLDDPYFN